MVALAAVLILLVAGQPLINLLFGQEFAGAYPVIMVLILAPLIGIVSFPLPSMLYALDRPDAPLKARLIGTILFFAIIAPLAWRFGVIGRRDGLRDRNRGNGRSADGAARAGISPGPGVTTSRSRIWVLLGERRGDNNQLLALAEGLGVPFETRTLSYRKSWALWLRLFPARPYLLTKDAREELAPPWPNLTIGIGRRSVAVARWIKAMSGGRTKIVRLGNPRADPRRFDLVVTTAQYPVARAVNVLVLPTAMGRYAEPPTPKNAEANWLASLPRPHLLLSLGGPTRYWRFDDEQIAATAKTLGNKAAEAGGTLIVAPSPRTPASSLAAIHAAGVAFVSDERMRYGVLLADADEHFVTADSVSMISEAVLTGKPVGLVPVELDEEGEHVLGREGFSSSTRDIRRFWTGLRSEGLVGSVERPANGIIENPVKTAAAAVQRLLGDGVE